MTKIQGQELVNLCNSEIEKHGSAIDDIASRFNPKSTFPKWHKLIRSIEEFINTTLLTSSHDEVLTLLFDMDLKYVVNNPSTLIELQALLANKYSSQVSKRYLDMLIKLTALNIGFSQETQKSLFITIFDAARYLQSRRRYYISFLYALPNSKGLNGTIEEIYLFNDFGVVVELNCIAKTSFRNSLVLNEIYKDYYLESDGFGASGSHDYRSLDDLFLEPERLSAIESSKASKQYTNTFKELPVDKKKVFSTNELLNSINLLIDLYAEFNLKETEFSTYFEIIKKLLPLVEDDYYLKIPKQRLDNILKLYPSLIQKKLINTSKNYDEAQLTGVRVTLINV